MLRWASIAVLCAAAKHPAPVRPGAKGLGGGSPDLPGHGAPMQEQPGRRELQSIDALPPWAEFFERFVRTNTPVVVRGAATPQPAFERWTDEYLARKHGDMQIDAEVKKIEERDGPKKSMKLRKFVKATQNPKHDQRFYAIIGFERYREWLEDFAIPSAVDCEEIIPQSATLWWSSGGTRSVLHNDDAENFLLQLDGKKEVFLVHQDNAHNVYAAEALHPGTSAVHQEFVDLEMFPRFHNISWIGGTVEKGDLLYIPHSYWHQVNSHGRNLAVNFWWGHVDEYQWWDGSGAAPKAGTSFDRLKGRYAEQVRCTPRGRGVSHADFGDEEVWKGFLQAQSRAAKKRQKLTTWPAFHAQEQGRRRAEEL